MRVGRADLGRERQLSTYLILKLHNTLMTIALENTMNEPVDHDELSESVDSSLIC